MPEDVIVQRILEARDQFVYRTGEFPRELYLGKEEEKAYAGVEREYYCRGWMVVMEAGDPYLGKREFMGMEVLEVLKDSHLRVGF